MTRREIVIVGGGIAGLTAAFEISDPCRCRARRSGCLCADRVRHRRCSQPRIELYERRRELGGKGASVRNEQRDMRIEEHGLHIWFGYYENAFRLLDRCHMALDDLAERGVRRWSSAISDVATGFRRASTVGLADDDASNNDWIRWWTKFPEDDALPWNRTNLDAPSEFDLRWFLPEVGRRTTDLLHAAMRSLVVDGKGDDIARLALGLDSVLSDFDPVLNRLFSAALSWSSYLRRQSARTPQPTLVFLALSSLNASSQLLEYVRNTFDAWIARSPTARRILTIIDLMVGSTRGLLAAGIANDADIDRLDVWEWSDWLAANGVLSPSRDSTLVRALSYCLPFAYQCGDRDRPSFSAAVGIRLFLRTFFTYRGALMWKMNYGMGEVVFAPLYELLRKRGVEFHFDHQLDGIAVDDGRVSELRFKQPAAPLVRPPDAEDCWPMARLALDQGSLCYWPRREQPPCTEPASSLSTLDRDVVLAIPLRELQDRAPSFINATARWHQAVNGRPRKDGLGSPRPASVATHAAQLWLTEPATALGWPLDITASGFAEPFDTFSDMTELLKVEPKPREEPIPRGLVYLCSVRPDPPMPPRPAPPTLVEDLALFLGQRAGYLWPDARGDQGKLAEEVVIGVDTNGSLQDIGKDISSTKGSRAPFYRENDEPADRYNLSLPGTAELRIEPGNTGYENLYAAGDWTACILNAGCIEAAAISGMLAAEALLAEQLPIIGRLEQVDSTQITAAVPRGQRHAR